MRMLYNDSCSARSLTTHPLQEVCDHSDNGRKEQGSLSNVRLRSGVATYAGAARCRVHLAPVLLPSGHPSGSSKFRHAHFPYSGLHVTQIRATRAVAQHHSPRWVPTGQDLVSTVLCNELRDVPVET